VAVLQRSLAWFFCGLSCACGAGPGIGWIEERISTRAEFGGVHFLDPDRGFIVGGSYFIDGGLIGATEDGGRSWEFQSGFVRAKKGFRLTDVVFLDRFTGIAVGTHGVILRTTDRGRHWHPVRQHTGVTDHLFDIFFLDQRLGWAVGFLGMVHTTDGGRSWSRLGETRAVSGAAVYFLDRETGMVADTGGRIHRTSDGGESWQVITDRRQTGTADLLDLEFLGPSLGWAVGTEGMILHTTDGGRSWSRQDSGVRARLHAVAFPSLDHGWVVGSDRESSSSVLLRTSDGGATWRTDLVVRGELLHELFFLDDNHGWAVGERPEHGPQALLRYRPH